MQFHLQKLSYSDVVGLYSVDSWFEVLYAKVHVSKWVSRYLPVTAEFRKH